MSLSILSKQLNILKLNFALKFVMVVSAHAQVKVVKWVQRIIFMQKEEEEEEKSYAVGLF